MAGSPARKPATRKTSGGHRSQRSRRGTSRSRAKQPLFHGGSFFTGMLVGIGATIVGALLPGWWEESAIAPQLSTAEPQEAPATTRFEFWDRLPRNSRNPDSTTHGRSVAVDDTEFLVQAGSFETPDDADRMRASLLLLGLSVSTRPVTLDSGATWHRVLVGPFDSETDTRRAITRLREQDIEPLLLKRTKP